MHRVLSVGQCGYDHRRLSNQILRDFAVSIVPASTFAEALNALRAAPHDLVLVNRVTDADGSRGLDLIRTLKSDPELATIPVMLVSNIEEAQREAGELGALPGFGKQDLGTLTAVERLAPVLALGPA